MLETMGIEPVFPKALEDLVRLVFDELDLGLSDFLWSKHKGIHDNFHRVFVDGVPYLMQHCHVGLVICRP